MPAVPKPPARVKAVKKPLKRGPALKTGKPLAKSTKPLKKSGETKRKKVARYAAYLRSPAWKAKRREAIQAAKHRCEHCGKRECDGQQQGIFGDYPDPVRLHVHHRTYVRFREELPEDLLVLCASCHSRLERQSFPHRQRNR